MRAKVYLEVIIDYTIDLLLMIMHKPHELLHEVGPQLSSNVILRM